MRKQVVVIGMGRFGSTVARTLSQLGHEVLALDKDERTIQEIMPFVTDAIVVDSTDERALRELGLEHLDVGVVAVGRDIPSSLMITVLLKRLGLPHIISRATTELHGATLERIGADRVAFPEQETGVRIAHNLTASNVTDYIEVNKDFGIGKMVPLEKYYSKTLEEVGIAGTGRGSLHVLLIQRGNDMIVAPDRFERILKGDLLVVSGRDEELQSFASTNGA